MTRLYGADAELELGARWRVPQQRLPGGATQEVIHVHRRDPRSPADPPIWAIRSQAFQTWQAGGPTAEARALAKLCRARGWVPYVRNARLARDAGTTISRIFMLPRSIASRPGVADWRNYVADVLFPFFAAKAGEELILVWQDEFEAIADHPPLRDIDVNLWGAGCVMLTGYAPDGEVAWREFFDLGTPEADEALSYIKAVVEFARTHGVHIPRAPVPA